MGFGFLDITLIDVIDVFVVALIMFQIYRFTRGTNALRIVAGILLEIGRASCRERVSS